MLQLAVSSRALFNLEDGHAIFLAEGGEAYDAYMLKHEGKPLRPGVAFALIKKLLALNTPGQHDKVGVAILSRNSTAACVRVMSSIQHHDLPIDKAVFTGGSERFMYAKHALAVDLFLSANPEDTRKAIQAGVAAATVFPSTRYKKDHDDIRIAFDGDAVIFGDSGERLFKTEGLAAFHASEQKNARIPLPAGPLKDFLMELSALKKEGAPIRIALVTARGVPAYERALRTLRGWGVSIDEAVLTAGDGKGSFLKSFGADLFFDDTVRHVEHAKDYVATGHVPSGVNNE